MNTTTDLYGTSEEPGISEYVRGIRRWAEYRAGFPTLSVPHEERTLAQHLEAMGINDLNRRRLVRLGERNVYDRVLADLRLIGGDPDEIPEPDVLRYAEARVRVMYLELHEQRWAEIDARRAVKEAGL